MLIILKVFEAMRMFEATGVGSCLISDHKNNNDEYFVPEKEIVVYKINLI